MSQKSSVPQAVSFVPQVLKRDSAALERARIGIAVLQNTSDNGRIRPRNLVIAEQAQGLSGRGAQQDRLMARVIMPSEDQVRNGTSAPG
jgi:hypothetical protein